MNCKPGQMCEVLCSRVKENKGLIVEVIRVNPSQYGYGVEWYCKPAWPIFAVDPYGKLWPRNGDLSSAPDKWLRPILPPQEPQTIAHDDEVTA